MAKAFNLNANLYIAKVNNLAPIISSIKKQLGGLNAEINLKLGGDSTNKIDAFNVKLNLLNKNLNEVSRSAKTAETAINSLSSSFNRFNANPTFKNIEAQAKSLSKVKNQVQEVTNELEVFGRQAGQSLKRFAAFTLSTVAIFKFVNAVQDGISEAINFQDEVVKISQVTGRTVGDLASLESEVRRLSVGLGVSSKELLNTAQVLAQAGLSADETRISLQALAKSTLAPTFKSIENTTEGAIAAMAQFKIEAKDLESTLGSLNSVSAAYAVESEDLITAIRKAGGVFSSSSRGLDSGVNQLQELSALFTSVRATTRESAESIGNGLNTIFSRIQRPKTIEFLRQFNIELEKGGQFVGGFDAIKNISKAIEGIPDRSLVLAKIVEEIGGFRQAKVVIPLLQNFALAEDALSVAQEGQTSLTRDAVTAQQSLAVQIKATRENFLALVSELSKTGTFQNSIKLALGLANAIVEITRAIKDLVPLLAVVAGTQVFKASGSVLRGLVNNISGRDKRLAGGGYINTGRGGIDDVPALLMRGEYVLNRDAVSKIGVGALNSLNSGNVQKFASGGPVGRDIVKNLKGADIQQLLNVISSTQKATTGNTGLPQETFTNLVNEYSKVIRDENGKIVDVLVRVERELVGLRGLAGTDLDLQKKTLSSNIPTSFKNIPLESSANKLSESQAANLAKQILSKTGNTINPLGSKGNELKLLASNPEAPRTQILDMAEIRALSNKSNTSNITSASSTIDTLYVKELDFNRRENLSKGETTQLSKLLANSANEQQVLRKELGAEVVNNLFTSSDWKVLRGNNNKIVDILLTLPTGETRGLISAQRFNTQAANQINTEPETILPNRLRFGLRSPTEDLPPLKLTEPTDAERFNAAKVILGQTQNILPNNSGGNSYLLQPSNELLNRQKAKVVQQGSEVPDNLSFGLNQRRDALPPIPFGDKVGTPIERRVKADRLLKRRVAINAARTRDKNLRMQEQIIQQRNIQDRQASFATNPNILPIPTEGPYTETTFPPLSVPKRVRNPRLTSRTNGQRIDILRSLVKDKGYKFNNDDYKKKYDDILQSRISEREERQKERATRQLQLRNRNPKFNLKKRLQTLKEESGKSIDNGADFDSTARKFQQDRENIVQSALTERKRRQQERIERKSPQTPTFRTSQTRSVTFGQLNNANQVQVLRYVEAQAKKAGVSFNELSSNLNDFSKVVVGRKNDIRGILFNPGGGAPPGGNPLGPKTPPVNNLDENRPSTPKNRAGVRTFGSLSPTQQLAVMQGLGENNPKKQLVKDSTIIRTDQAGKVVQVTNDRNQVPFPANRQANNFGRGISSRLKTPEDAAKFASRLAAVQRGVRQQKLENLGIPAGLSGGISRRLRGTANGISNGFSNFRNGSINPNLALGGSIAVGALASQFNPETSTGAGIKGAALSGSSGVGLAAVIGLTNPLGLALTAATAATVGFVTSVDEFNKQKSLETLANQINLSSIAFKEFAEDRTTANRQNLTNQNTTSFLRARENASINRQSIPNRLKAGFGVIGNSFAQFNPLGGPVTGPTTFEEARTNLKQQQAQDFTNNLAPLSAEIKQSVKAGILKPGQLSKEERLTVASQSELFQNRRRQTGKSVIEFGNSKEGQSIIDQIIKNLKVPVDIKPFIVLDIALQDTAKRFNILTQQLDINNERFKANNDIQDNFLELFSGGFSIANSVDTEKNSRLLSRPDVLSPEKFREIGLNVAGDNSSLKEAVNTVTESKIITDALSDIVKNIDTNQFNETNTIGDVLKPLLAKRGLENPNSEILSGILNNLNESFQGAKNTNAGLTAEEFINKDLKQKIGEAGQAQLEFLQNAAKIDAERAKLLLQNQDKYARVLQQGTEKLAQVQSLRAENELKLAELEGRTPTLDRLNAPLFSTIQGLVGRGNNSPENIFGRAKGISQGIQNAELIPTPQIIAEFNNLNKALEILANDTTRFANAIKKAEEATRKRTVVEDFAFKALAENNPVEIFKQAQAFELAGQVNKGDTKGLNRLNLPNFLQNLPQITELITNLQGENAGKQFKRNALVGSLQARGLLDTPFGKDLIKNLDKLGKDEEIAKAAAKEALASQAKAAELQLQAAQLQIEAAARQNGVQPPAPLVPRNRGGIIPGGGPNRDSVFAHLTPGEFVVNRNATNANMDLLMAINGGYNAGGVVKSRKEMILQQNVARKAFYQQQIDARKKARLSKYQLPNERRESLRPWQIKNIAKNAAEGTPLLPEQKDLIASLSSAQRKAGSQLFKQYQNKFAADASKVPNAERIASIGRFAASAGSSKLSEKDRAYIQTLSPAQRQYGSSIYQKAKGRRSFNTGGLVGGGTSANISGGIESLTRALISFGKYAESLIALNIPERITVEVAPIQSVVTLVGETELARYVAERITNEVVQIVGNQIKGVVNTTNGEVRDSFSA